MHAEEVGSLREKLRLVQSDLTAQQERNINIVEEYQGTLCIIHYFIHSFMTLIPHSRHFSYFLFSGRCFTDTYVYNLLVDVMSCHVL